MATEVKRTIKPSGQGGDYTTLAAWEAGEQQDLVANDRYAIAEISGDWTGISDGPAVVDGWTSDADHYLHIYTLGSARHAGQWTASAYRIAANSHTLRVYSSHVRVVGLQLDLDNTSGSSKYGLVTRWNQGQVAVVVDACIARCQGTAALAVGFDIEDTVGSQVRNCVAYGFTATSSQGFFWLGSGGRVRNCTAYDCASGFVGTNARADNCLAQACTDGFGPSLLSASTHNCSDLAGDAPGSNAVTGTAQFLDAGAGDFHLSPSDAVARGAGADWSADFTTDIDGDPIHTWSIGADAQAAPPPTIALLGITPRPANTVIQVQLADALVAIDAATVGPGALEFTYEATLLVAGVDYEFAYDASTERITLLRPGGGTWAPGTYTLRFNGAGATLLIADTDGFLAEETLLTLDLTAVTASTCCPASLSGEQLDVAITVALAQLGALWNPAGVSTPAQLRAQTACAVGLPAAQIEAMQLSVLCQLAQLE